VIGHFCLAADNNLYEAPVVGESPMYPCRSRKSIPGNDRGKLAGMSCLQRQGGPFRYLQSG
jgi:hypothetical protein